MQCRRERISSIIFSNKKGQRFRVSDVKIAAESIIIMSKGGRSKKKKKRKVSA
jgi:hypothetical protein